MVPYSGPVQFLDRMGWDSFPSRYVLILYTEDQAVQNDGTLSDPIYFEARQEVTEC